MLMNPSQTLLYNVVCFALLSQTLLIYAALEMALLLSFCKYYFLLFLTHALLFVFWDLFSYLMILLLLLCVQMN